MSGNNVRGRGAGGVGAVTLAAYAKMKETDPERDSERTNLRPHAPNDICVRSLTIDAGT